MIDNTKPVDSNSRLITAPHVVVAATYRDPITNALYVHKDLEYRLADWEVEQHISPPKETVQLGDVESWVGFVRSYGDPETALLTWSERGLKATLDYHGRVNGEVDGKLKALNVWEYGRCAWHAEHRFEASRQWDRWAGLACGQVIGQRSLLERLEDYSEDIVEPDPAAVVNILRMLRATVSASADTELRADGSTSVAWTKSSSVRSGELTLPPTITIAIPVLKGHVVQVDDKTMPVLYRLAVRIRVSVDDDAHLAFRLSIPEAERVLEAVYADRVGLATRMLAGQYSLFRASGR